MRTERRLLFGGVAELYEQTRPSYPGEMVDELIASSGIADSGRALEVGAGTGKATRLFAARGIPVLALEPDAEMVAVARRIFAPYDAVTVEQTEFERFDPGRERFALLFCAQAWHWLSPQRRYRKAREVLRPDGLLAAFWNRPRWERASLRAKLLEAYLRAAPAFDSASDPDPMHPGTDTALELGDAWELELGDTSGFTDPRVVTYDWSLTYTTSEYLALLQTHSGHMIRSPAERAAIIEQVGAAIERAGGKIELPLTTVLCTGVAA